ncbi:MAG TPA: thioesterase family protein [Acidimicrobiia bacterium]|nr:thioesterase family protein [Acidimicrobiia bacterium]
MSSQSFEDHASPRAGRLEAALTVAPVGDRWHAIADPGYEASNGMFGGWTTAIALAAVLRTADVAHTPSAITINFLSAVAPGAAIEIRTERLGGGRSVSHWRADVHPAGSGELHATANVVLTDRRATDTHLQLVMPSAPEPDDLPEFHPPDPAGERSVIRPVSGMPPFGRGDTYSVGWVRELSGRPVDHVQLAYLADQCAPRSFFWSDGPRRSATLTMTVYFHATADELAAVGDDYVLHEAFATRGVASTADQHVRMWSRSGTLLATSEQICLYR